MMRYVAAVAIVAGMTGTALAEPVVLARCGASKGQGYFFNDPVMNPNPSAWEEDGISNGTIFLVAEDDKFDIRFDDALSAGIGYRAEGAEVIMLGSTENLIRVGAFHANYSEIYTFDLKGKVVIWTSSKTGPITAKVAIYEAKCD